jgi:hypothetical protein
MLSKLVMVLTSLMVIGARVERWSFVGRGEVSGQFVSYSRDETWPAERGAIRTSHWQLVFDSVQPDGTREYRFVDRVDCDRERRAAEIVERYDDQGNLLHRKVVPEDALQWSSIANDSIEATVDGWFCIDGPN